MGKKSDGSVRSLNQFDLNDTLSACSSIYNALSGTCNGTISENIKLLRSLPKPDPAEYLSADSFFDDYTMYNLIRKFPLLDKSVDTKQIAINKLLECEDECRVSNRVIRQCLATPGDFPELYNLLWVMKRKIAKIIGDFDWDSVIKFIDFGPGSTTRLPRSKSCLYNKLKGAPHLTADTLPLFHALQAYRPGLFTEDAEVVSGNKIVTVPKDASTDRPIAIEPDINMLFQKGIGKLIRSLLKRRTREKIDLQDQTINQRFAKIASLQFGLATVDLSSASDSISFELVSFLLPSDWRDALYCTRSHNGTLPDGTVIRYQKWSSMGNGYTFELESLIFYALCSSVRDLKGNGNEVVSVYGDDLVISSSLYPALSVALSSVGFKVNSTKSYKSGPFFESCGKHYFLGTDVTPIYVDGIPLRLPDRVSFINEIILLSSRHGKSLYRDIRFKPVVDSLIKTLPHWLQRPCAPVSHKGNALIGDFDECLPHLSRKRGWDGFIFNGIVSVDITSSYPCGATILKSSLFSLEWRFSEDMSSAENQILHRKVKRKKIFCNSWSYLGGWF